MKRPKYLRQIAEKITKTETKAETKTIFIPPDFYRIAEPATLNACLKQMTESGYIRSRKLCSARETGAADDGAID